YYKDDSCWSADLKSKTTEDIISIGRFVEVLVLILYVLVGKILLVSEVQHLLKLSTSTFACDTEYYNVTPLSASYPGLQPTTPTAGN
ncbi:hypothetical protein Tco_0205071, partial [Tanacetum coccineum]